MTKYVCDFAQVTSAGNKLIEAASQMLDATTAYSSNLESDLSGWSGQAKNSFSTQSSSQIDIAKNKAQSLNEFGEFIVNSAKSIQDLDDSLANLNI